VEAGRFRQDLFYRLNVIELRMPPLRECREDVAAIAQAVLARFAAAGGGAAPARLSPGALAALAAHDFPGNIRELENILERAVALSGAEQIEPEDLRLERPERGEAGSTGSLPDYLDRLEREAILQALRDTGFNRTAAAQRLGVSFRSLRYRMQRLGVREQE